MDDVNDRLRYLSRHLTEANNIISTFMEQPVTSTTSAPSTATTTTSSATTVGSVLSRARAMISQSVSNGACSRLGRRERLRATSSPRQQNPPKKQKKDEQKVFEFVIVDVRESEGNSSWSFSEDIVLLRGIIQISNSSGEREMREQIGLATRMKYSILNNEDFAFLRATRRVLAKPVNSGAYDFKQVKLLAGQGSIYLKLKDHIYCLLQEGRDDDDDNMVQIRGICDERQHEPTSTEASSEIVDTPCSIVNIDGHDDAKVDDLATKIVGYCTSHNIEDPIEILRYFQKIMVEGRGLGIQDVSWVEEGETSLIMVDRYNILETSFEEVKSLENVRKTLEVQFYGETAQDLGGPRKEFFSIVVLEIYNKYFKNGLKEHMSEDYYTAGIILGLSILQNGKIPYFLDGERIGISSNNILRFATCDDEIPLLGYERGAKPSVTFYEVPENKSFIPTANTCSCKLQLPRPTIEVGLPDDDTLFDFYDMAFVSEYFGHK
ncbi:leucine-rich repeat-containing DDB_G0290503 isoform X1 [Paramuricea clavata]|uniref:HECT-type E3 ubiquitin transferase n=1 Tax=Paramuricea clavata TaxID=317549 RepID=A0A7D9JJ66_PARCT|nr:leucine-rich repeat-containing DDB_G0290503 isoform X1 [Paramuricea clavata]